MYKRQKVSLAAEVKDFDPTRVLDKKEARRMDRFTQFAVTAAVEAMAQSGLDLEREDTARMGVFVSSGIGGISTIQNLSLIHIYRAGRDGGARPAQAGPVDHVPGLRRGPDLGRSPVPVAGQGGEINDEIE